MAVCLIDLDRFKFVNDKYGHAIGDEVLRRAASRLTQLMDVTDVIGRDAGDEFVVVLTAPLRVKEVDSVAEGLRAALTVPFNVDGHKVRITASVGVARSEDVGPDADRLFKDADVALFAAKENGRDKVVRVTQAMAESASRNELQRALVRDALQAGKVRVHYQPIVDVNGAVVALEALARCEDQFGHTRFPDEFLSALTHIRLITDLDREVMRQALDIAVALRAAFDAAAPRVACNVSARSLARPDCASWILGELTERNLDPSALGIEITESAAFDADPIALAGLVEMRDAGAAIALDDFGTGYSSLSHLVDLPLTVLKIDKSFVQRADVVGPEHAIAKAVSTLGRSLGFMVIAEGVETASQARTIRELGVDHLQGWIVSKPLEASDLMNHLANGAGSAPLSLN